MGTTINGIGLNGLCRLKGEGVRGEMKAIRGSGPRPLVVSFLRIPRLDVLPVEIIGYYRELVGFVGTGSCRVVLNGRCGG